MEQVTVSKNKWEDIILKSDNAYFFHSPTWAKILEKTYNYRTATRLYNINGKSILIPMMEERNIYDFKTFDSMPYGYGGVFPESEISTDDYKCLLDNIIGGRHLILNLTLPPFLDISSLSKSAIKIKDEWDYTHILNLEGKDFEYIWNDDFSKSRRRNIHKAYRSNIVIRNGTSLDDFRAYYKLYAESSRKWGYESPPHPFNLYKNFHKYGSPHVELSLAIKDHKTIGGLIVFYYAMTVFCWGNTYLEDYGTFNPVSKLINNSIKQACQEGYKYFNFGASGKLKGVRRFKESFGAEKVDINKYRVLSNLGKLALFLNRILP